MVSQLPFGDIRDGQLMKNCRHWKKKIGSCNRKSKKKEDEIQHLQLENEKFLMQLKIKQRILDEFKSNDIIEECAKISVE